ncbi:DUF2262 domain-containing protein [Saccharibacillus sacchari]|uniref:DUF2262 domain-containing protein n=1 Tax=Saccharibacillus sacchari TaxID=456493 RepID=UPI0004B62541|nr:DUF2262 domain-containing protein [Saccharibacillus sacchari]
MYHDTTATLQLVQNAYICKPEAIQKLSEIQALHASSSDDAEVVLIQPKHAFRQPDGRIRVLNKETESGAESLLCADLYRCFPSGGSSWTHIPIPPSFVPKRIGYEEDEEGEDGRFVFESEEGRIVKATQRQMGMAFRELDILMTGATEEEIEQAFYAMEQTVVPPPPVKRTAADNPPIPWNGGTLVFESEYQWFGGETHLEDRAVTLNLESAERERALELVPALQKLTEELASLDLAARRYAAEQLLEVKNDSWLDENEEELTEDDFAGRMTLESLTLDEDEEMTLWYEDGDLFWGHSICVRRSADGEWMSAEMMG